jgi:hypothetical protein
MRAPRAILASVALVVGLACIACSSTPSDSQRCPVLWSLNFEGRSYVGHDGFSEDVPVTDHALAKTTAPPCEDRFGKMTLYAVEGISKRVAIVTPKYPDVVFVIDTELSLPASLEPYLYETA